MQIIAEEEAEKELLEKIRLRKQEQQVQLVA
jgi:hypothetical protein